MGAQWLREHVAHLKEHLDHFEQMYTQLEVLHHQSLQLHTSDPAVKSSLLENYSLNLERQKKAIERMSLLYQQACHQLAALESQEE